MILETFFGSYLGDHVLQLRLRNVRPVGVNNIKNLRTVLAGEECGIVKIRGIMTNCLRCNNGFRTNFRVRIVTRADMFDATLAISAAMMYRLDTLVRITRGVILKTRHGSC